MSNTLLRDVMKKIWQRVILLYSRMLLCNKLVLLKLYRFYSLECDNTKGYKS